ncbi:hypothetical protein [Salininema proteolyticum]|uniref:Head-to-tail stopper n=1 Tax=Salininema proteolyticum TaxID=1607685 RepID=A0ABV8TXN5_9ACTN
MIPERLLPHAVVVIEPTVTTDAYGNIVRDYDNPAARTETQAWLQQTTHALVISDGRAAQSQEWLMVTNHTVISGFDRIEWDTKRFDIDGPPRPVHTPAGGHHYELTLRLVEG